MNGINEWLLFLQLSAFCEQDNPDLNKKVQEDEAPSAAVDRPKTDASNYGCRLQTDVGQRLLSMQSKLITDSRKKKIARDLYAQWNNAADRKPHFVSG